jgi:hypothetical protein
MSPDRMEKHPGTGPVSRILSWAGVAEPFGAGAVELRAGVAFELGEGVGDGQHS